jgi:hypothetical protein
MDGIVGKLGPGKEQRTIPLKIVREAIAGWVTVSRCLRTETPRKNGFLKTTMAWRLSTRISNEVMLIGEGRLNDGTGVWTYEFHGKFNPNGTTTLKGNLRSTLGAVGGRTCAIEFG